MKAPVKDNGLQWQVEAARHRLAEFFRKAGEFSPQGLIGEVIEELSCALEELEVSAEEARAQSEELARAHWEVEAERERYRELFEFAPAGYLVTDRWGNLKQANKAAAAMLHWPQESLSGRPLVLFLDEKDHRTFFLLLSQLAEADMRGDWKVQLKPRPPVPVFPATLKATRIMDGAGCLSGLRWLMRDITARKQATEELEKARKQLHQELERRIEERTAELWRMNEELRREVAERKRAEEAHRESEERFRTLAKQLEERLIVSDRLASLGELAASIAHELNNPLTVVLGFVQDLRSEIKPSHPHYPAVKIIEDEAARCKKIIQDLLNLARPRHSPQDLVDVNAILWDTLNITSTRERNRNVRFAVQLGPDLPRVYGDEQQLQQVFLNLQLNALEAMPGGGVVFVLTEVKDAPGGGRPQHGGAPREILAEFKDTGVGIAAEDLGKIFYPFFTTKRNKGMGLGLSICDRIVASHGGRIEVESRLRRGSAFTVFLPVAPERQP